MSVAGSYVVEVEVTCPLCAVATVRRELVVRDEELPQVAVLASFLRRSGLDAYVSVRVRWG